MDKRYRLTRDILIPAGTDVVIEPPHKTEYFGDTVTVFIEVDKDHTSFWTMHLEDALETGMLVAEEIPEG